MWLHTLEYGWRSARVCTYLCKLMSVLPFLSNTWMGGGTHFLITLRKREGSVGTDAPEWGLSSSILFGRERHEENKQAHKWELSRPAKLSPYRAINRFIAYCDRPSWADVSGKYRQKNEMVIFIKDAKLGLSKYVFLAHPSCQWVGSRAQPGHNLTLWGQQSALVSPDRETN